MISLLYKSATKNKDVPIIFVWKYQAPCVTHHAGIGRARHSPCPPKIRGWPFLSHICLSSSKPKNETKKKPLMIETALH